MPRKRSGRSWPPPAPTKTSCKRRRSSTPKSWTTSAPKSTITSTFPYEATSDEELFIALTEQADAAYAEEGYDASARYRCYAEVLSETHPQWMETPDREMLAEAGVDPRSLAPGDEPQAVAVLAQAGMDADDEASDHWLKSDFEQVQAVLACCSPIALPARRRRACRLRDARFRSR